MTTILITGANRGIGFDLAREALNKGWQVYGSVRTGQPCLPLPHRSMRPSTS